MAVNMKGKDLLSIHDLSVEEVQQVLETTRLLKIQHLTGQRSSPLSGKSVALIFMKPSTRTRVSFEVAVAEMGGHPVVLSREDLQLKRGETIADTARVLSRYVHGIVIRAYAHEDVAELARYASVPVINALTDLLHPCQALADVFTIMEKKGRVSGLKLAYVGDGNNVAHSLMFAGAKTGLHVAVASPAGYEPNPEILRKAQEDSRLTGARILVVRDPAEAVRDADVVYTDVWTSMGQEDERERRVKALAAYQVSPSLMAQAKPDVIFMHCLPAHRGEEVLDEVIDGPNSVVWDQAENRLHVQKAILSLLL